MKKHGRLIFLIILAGIAVYVVHVMSHHQGQAILPIGK